jgi:hypothetical protein
MLDLPISRYRVHYQVTRPVKLPDYAGSALRGAFGHALKSIACMTATRNRGVCACQPAEQCLYRRLFDLPMQQVHHDQQQDVPPPLLIEPVMGGVILAAGQQGFFDVVLVGQFAHQQMPIIQLAWQRALHDGIGVADEQGVRGQAVFQQMILLNQPDHPIPPNPRHVHLQFLSPMRLQHHENLVTAEHLTPTVFLQAIVRRQRLFAQLYGGEPVEVALDTWSRLSETQLERRVRWMQWSRWSNRQKRQMTLGGLTGRIYLTNVPDELWRYLYLGQWLHAGKNSVFGLGQYRVIDQPWQPPAQISQPAQKVEAVLD